MNMNGGKAVEPVGSLSTLADCILKNLLCTVFGSNVNVTPKFVEGLPNV